MFMFYEEQVTVVLIILGVLALVSIFYGSSLHIINEQQKQSDTKTTSPLVAAAPKQIVLPPLPSPEEQRLARENQINLVQRTIQSKFDDVDTYFTTKSLMESARSLGQQQVQKQRDNYYDHVERIRMIRNPQLVQMAPPQVDVPHIPPVAPEEQIPWLPRPGSWDPLARRPEALNPRRIHRRRGEGVPLRPRRPRPAPTDYFTVYNNENAMRVANWLNNVPLGRPGSAAGSDHLFGAEGGGGNRNANAPVEAGGTISINSRMSHISI
jgi:hypothetical protein